MKLVEVISRWNETAKKGNVLKVKLRLTDGTVAVAYVSFIGDDYITCTGHENTMAVFPLSAIVSISDVTGDDQFAVSTLV